MRSGLSDDLPDYVLDPSPLAMFTRLQRVGLHLERLQADAMDGLDLNFADYTILATLHRAGEPHELAVSRLAELVIRPMGSITSVVDRLERGGLVTRRADPDDRRRVVIALTDEGLDAARRGDAAYRISRTRVLDEIEPEARGRIDDAIRALLDVLEADARTSR